MGTNDSAKTLWFRLCRWSCCCVSIHTHASLGRARRTASSLRIRSLEVCNRKSFLLCAMPLSWCRCDEQHTTQTNKFVGQNDIKMSNNGKLLSREKCMLVFRRVVMADRHALSTGRKEKATVAFILFGFDSRADAIWTNLVGGSYCINISI